MSVQIKIQLTDEAQALIAGLQTLPERVVLAIANAMDQQNLRTASHIQQHHLTGIGPFPVAEHKLGVRSSRLRGSVLPSAATISGNTVDSSIGSNVKYAAIHEFGGRVHRKARQQKLRFKAKWKEGTLEKMRNGKIVAEVLGSYVLKKRGKGKNLLSFAKKDDQTAYERVVNISERDIDYPDRAPFRTGIQECVPQYRKAISAAIVRAFKP